MPEDQEPKKPSSRRKNKSKKVTLNVKKAWQNILNEIEKHEVPIDMLQHVVVSLVDGTQVLIDIQHLLLEIEDAEVVEQILHDKFADLDDYIDSVDFFIDVDLVSLTIQPLTDELLKNI